jgi:hypothetical protein
MAMAYSSGTFSSESQPGQYLYSLIATFLATQSTVWAFVEDYAASSSSGSTYSTWKSLGTANTAGTDFFVTFQYQTSTQNAGSSQFYMTLYESYNATGHLVNFPAMYLEGNTPASWPDATSSYRYNVTPFIVSGTPFSFQKYISFAPTTGTNNYFLWANADGFVLSILNTNYSISNPAIAYAGSGSTLVAPSTNDPSPLFLADLGGSLAVGSTRDPGYVGTNANGYPWSYNYGIWTPTGSTLGSTTTYDLYQNGGRAVASRTLIFKNVGSPAYYSIGGYLRALLPAWMLYLPTTGLLIGDTSVIGGTDNFIYLGAARFLDLSA